MNNVSDILKILGNNGTEETPITVLGIAFAGIPVVIKSDQLVTWIKVQMGKDLLFTSVPLQLRNLYNTYEENPFPHDPQFHT